MLCPLSGTQSCQLVPTLSLEQIRVRLCVLCPLSGTQSCQLVPTLSLEQTRVQLCVLCPLSGTQSCQLVPFFFYLSSEQIRVQLCVLFPLSGTQSCQLVHPLKKILSLVRIRVQPTVRNSKLSVGALFFNLSLEQIRVQLSVLCPQSGTQNCQLVPTFI